MGSAVGDLMRSHTIPRKLLEQFAYDDTITGAKRLWRYEKGRPPHGCASPRTATRVDGHFVDPEDPIKEVEIEERMNKQFEQPVNTYLSRLSDPEFELTDLSKRQLTFYVMLLFLRSEARRKGSLHLEAVLRHALELFLQNDVQVRTVATKRSIDLFFGGVTSYLVTKEQFIREMRAAFDRVDKNARAQNSYVTMLQLFMSEIDEKVFKGKWSFIRTVPADPFVISDAPVVTWERTATGESSYGVGFHRTNVEVLLPVSPLVCLHILPAVERSVPVLIPSVREVNAAQAAFATRFCFANIASEEINLLFQENFGRAELGVRSFTVWHRDYSTAYYDRLMNGEPARPAWWLHAAIKARPKTSKMM
jgi:hypothetical protein